MPDSRLNPIQALEELKDKIIAAFRGHNNLGQNVIDMWCGDARELYFTVLAARDLLQKDPSDTAGASGLLAAASSHSQRVASELRTLGSSEAGLEEELHQAFRACHDELCAQIPKSAAGELSSPSERVIRISDEEYTLPCSVCGKPAVQIYRAGEEEKILKGLICAGITRSFSLDPQYQAKILAWLAAGDLASVHSYLEKDVDIDGGLDAYCPACDRIYCYIHYNVSREFDEGFYDCCYGVCPQEHRRVIDD